MDDITCDDCGCVLQDWEDRTDLCTACVNLMESEDDYYEHSETDEWHDFDPDC